MAMGHVACDSVSRAGVDLEALAWQRVGGRAVRSGGVARPRGVGETWIEVGYREATARVEVVVPSCVRCTCMCAWVAHQGEGL